MREFRRGAVITFAAALPVLALPVANGAEAESGRETAQTCIACHGPGGNSGNPVVPSLAGQPRQFIETQLVMFREGNRKDAQMSPIAANLSNKEVNELAAFFSAQTRSPPARSGDPAKAAAGRRLTEQNHCVSCHGPALMGQQHIPRLAGQQRDYLRIQLRGFRAGTRFDMDGNMTSIAQSLSDADIETLADYLSTLK